MRSKLVLKMKTWNAAAIKAEERELPDQLWKGGHSLDRIRKERLKRIGRLLQDEEASLQGTRVFEVVVGFAQ